MKQVSVRLDEKTYDLIINIAKENNMALNTTILTQINSPGDVYTTSYENKVQLRINLTYLGDLLVCGYRKSFDGIYNLMEDHLSRGFEVILQKNYSNAPYQELRFFKDIDELLEWKKSITSALER